MLHDVDADPMRRQPALEVDPPQPTKPAALTGALVQRGRDRAGRVPELAPVARFEPNGAQEAPAPAFAPGAAAPGDEVPLVFAGSRHALAAEAPPSRWSDVLFVAACCAAFFATFLFALRF